MKGLHRILLAGRVAAVAGVVALFTLLAATVAADGYQETSTVGGKTVTFAAATDTTQTRADVAAVKAKFDAAVAGSEKMGELVTKDLTINVHRDNPAVTVGNQVSGSVVNIDVGDVEALSGHLTDGDADKAKVANSLVTDVIGHEVSHTTGTTDPPGSPSDANRENATGGAVDDANTVLGDLEAGIQRDQYCYTDDKDTEETDDDEVVSTYTVGEGKVTVNMTKFAAARADDGKWMGGCVLSVGGIGDFPDVEEPVVGTAESSGGSSAPYAALAGAAAAVVALAAGGWYARRRLLG